MNAMTEVQMNTAMMTLQHAISVLSVQPLDTWVRLSFVNLDTKEPISVYHFLDTQTDALNRIRTEVFTFMADAECSNQRRGRA